MDGVGEGRGLENIVCRIVREPKSSDMQITLGSGKGGVGGECGIGKLRSGRSLYINLVYECVLKKNETFACGVWYVWLVQVKKE